MKLEEVSKDLIMKVEVNKQLSHELRLVRAENQQLRNKRKNEELQEMKHAIKE